MQGAVNQPARTPRICPDCGQLAEMGPREKRCAACRNARKAAQMRDRYRALHPEPQTHAVICAACGQTFHTTYNNQYCPACSTPEAKAARAAARARARKQSGKVYAMTCNSCGKSFTWPTKRLYCPDCSTDAARHRRSRGRKVSEIIENTRDGESVHARKARMKYEKLLRELISGDREPKNNHEAIIRVEALGRIHGGAFGSYGKEVAGYYAQKE